MEFSEIPIRCIFQISVFIILVLTIFYPLMMSPITISQPPKPPTTTTVIERDVYRIEIHHPPYALIGDEVRIWGSVELICPTNVTRLDVRRFRIVLANGRPLKILYEPGDILEYLPQYCPEYSLVNISIIVSASGRWISEGKVWNVPTTRTIVFLPEDPFRIHTEEYGYYLLLDLRNITLSSGSRKKYTFEVSFEVLGQVLIAYDTQWRKIIEEPGKGEGLGVGFVVYIGADIVRIETLFPVVVGEVQALIKGLQEEKSRLLEENTRLQERLYELTKMYSTVILILLILLVIVLIVVARRYGY